MAAECATTVITRMARLLEVSTSGYCKRVNRSATSELTDREQRKADLTVKIIDHHRDSGGVYGSPRITAELRAAGETWSHWSVPAPCSTKANCSNDPSTSRPPNLADQPKRRSPETTPFTSLENISSRPLGPRRGAQAVRA